MAVRCEKKEASFFYGFSTVYDVSDKFQDEATDYHGKSYIYIYIYKYFLRVDHVVVYTQNPRAA